MPVIRIDRLIVVLLDLLLTEALVGTVRLLCILIIDPVEIFQRKPSQLTAVHLPDKVAIDGREHVGNGLLPARDLVDDDK